MVSGAIRSIRSGLGAIALMVLVAMPASVDAANSSAIATAVTVRPEATGVLNGASKVIIAADQLFQGQKITTGAQGQVEIVFADDTRMVVGPGSSLVIETYLMRNGGTASNFAVNALGGTFRFITGKSAKSAYHINTPTATIGVRGTKFDFAVDKKTRETTVFLYEGQVQLCPTNGGCKNVSGVCNVGQSDDQTAQTFGAGTQGANVVTKFPYVTSQQRLSGNFKVRAASNCGQPQAQETVQKSAPEQDTKPPGNPDPLPDPTP